MRDAHFPLEMGIIELLTRIGEPHIRTQLLMASLTNARTRLRGDTLLTFGTNQITATDIARGTYPMVGLVVWIPALRVEHALRPPEVIRALHEENPPC